MAKIKTKIYNIVCHKTSQSLYSPGIHKIPLREILNWSLNLHLYLSFAMVVLGAIQK